MPTLPSPKVISYSILSLFLSIGALFFLFPQIFLDEKNEQKEEPTEKEEEPFPQETRKEEEIIPKPDEVKESTPVPAPENISVAEPVKPFGKISLTPDLTLDGAGTNIDSPEIFEADTPEETLLFVTGKGNDRVEVWKFPFQGKELSPIKRDSLPNGIVIEQDRNLLLIGDADKQKVDVHSLPDLKRIHSFGEGKLESGETNVDVLTQKNGKKRVYVTESHGIDIFDLDSRRFEFSFSPDVESIEEVLADSFHQIIYVPEENGVESKKHRGGAITAYSPDGKPYKKNGSHVFGKGLFAGDGEGITLYICRDKNGKDSGQGLIIAADQHPGAENGFEFFDRETWQHLGTLHLKGVTATDGITASSRPLPGYPQGLLAVSNNDTTTDIISWKKISEATKLTCP